MHKAKKTGGSHVRAGNENKNDNSRRLPDWLENATETELANCGPSETLAEAVRKYEAYHGKAKAEVDRELLQLADARVLAQARMVTQAEARRRRNAAFRVTLRGETDPKWAGWLAGKDKAPKNENKTK